MTLLRDAAAEGRLTFEELADRLDAAARATVRSDLSRLTRDLPASLDHEAVPATGAGTDLARSHGANSVFGDLQRSGQWTVPSNSRWSTVFGDVILDLREARVETAEVHIEASSIFGDTVLLVPEGVTVHVRSRTFFGDVRQNAGQNAPPGAPVVVLTGGTWFGDVRVQARRLREHFTALFRGSSR